MITPPIDLSDLQAVFDYIVRGIMAQGGPAWSEGNEYEPPGCMTLAPDGKRCAVGQLIPLDYPVTARGQGAPLGLFARVYFPNAISIPRDMYHVLSRLMETHDDVAINSGRGPEFMPVFLSRARLAAEDLGLSLNPELFPPNDED